MELEIKNCNQIHWFELAVRLPAFKLIRILLRPVIKHTAHCIPLDVKISFRDKSVYRSHGKCDTLTNSKTMLFHAF